MNWGLGELQRKSLKESESRNFPCLNNTNKSYLSKLSSYLNNLLHEY